LPLAIQNVNTILSSVVVYPNPANDVLQVKYSNLQNGHFVLTDITGRTIYSIQLQGTIGIQQIDVHSIAAGMYLYRVTDNQSIKGQGKITKL